MAVALYAVGKIDSLEEVKDWIDIVHHHVPNKENTAIYLEMFYMYERLYNRLKEEFDCINLLSNVNNRGLGEMVVGIVLARLSYYFYLLR